MGFNPLLIPTALLAVGLFWLGSQLARRFPNVAGALTVSGVVVSLPGLCYVVYYFHLFDNALWFYEWRALPLTELCGAGIGFLAGVLQSRFDPETRGERLVLPVIAAALISVPYLKPILSPLDTSKLHDTCEGEVCMQSTFSTCGPSSAATVLKALGVTSSEKELAKEAFTYQGGTESWYLARALRRRGLNVRFHIQSPAAMNFPASSIAGVVLPGGAGHFVAILADSPKSVTVADPLKGKMLIPKSESPHYYHFTGFFLVIDKPARTL